MIYNLNMVFHTSYNSQLKSITRCLNVNTIVHANAWIHFIHSVFTNPKCNTLVHTLMYIEDVYINNAHRAREATDCSGLSQMNEETVCIHAHATTCYIHLENATFGNTYA